MLIESDVINQWDDDQVKSRDLSKPALQWLMMGLCPGIGRNLFADDGALWKRGRNLEFITYKLQKEIQLNCGIKIGDLGFYLTIDQSTVIY